MKSSDDLFSIDLARALELFAAPKRSGRRQAAAKRVIAKIEVPGGGAPLQVLEGRYGPYITDGETNASVPRGMDPATLSLDDAQALLEARRGAAPAGRKREIDDPVEAADAKAASATRATIVKTASAAKALRKEEESREP